MPRVHLMTFEPTGNTCAILLARAFGTVVASSLVQVSRAKLLPSVSLSHLHVSLLALTTSFGDIATMRPLGTHFCKQELLIAFSSGTDVCAQATLLIAFVLHC